jgi:hypothetical protein
MSMDRQARPAAEDIGREAACGAEMTDTSLLPAARGTT